MNNTYINDEGQFAQFLRVEIVRDLNYIELEMSNYDLIHYDTPVAPSEFIKKLKIFEEKRERTFSNSNYRARYGAKFILMLPHGSWSLNKKIKLVRSFVKDVRGQEYHLKFFAWEQVKGLAHYIHIYISDRLYYDCQQSFYARDYYQDRLTGKMISKNEPGAIKTHSKGDSKEMIYKSFGEIKTRIFIYKDFTSWINRFKELFKQCLLKSQALISSKYVFSRKKFSDQCNRYLKRIYIELNYLQAYIENELYLALKDVQRHADTYDVHRYGYSEEDMVSLPGKTKLDNLYFKYKGRFEKGRFHHHNTEYKISPTKRKNEFIRIDQVEVHLKLLKKMFDEEITSNQKI